MRLCFLSCLSFPVALFLVSWALATQQTSTALADNRLRAVLHVGAAKCGFTMLQSWLYGELLRKDLQSDGFAVPSETDFPGRSHSEKRLANLAVDLLIQEDAQMRNYASTFFFSGSLQTELK